MFLVTHTDKCKRLFDKEKSLLETIIGDDARDIQHFGSTAIKGIEAKPIIDILVGVESLKDVEKFNKEKLKEAGYYHLSRVQIDGKEVFAKFTDLENLTKTHILHVVEYGDSWWKEHISFRDYLNTNESVAKEYESLKKYLVEKYSNDERSYTDEKKQFVDDILNRM
ncbi:GrpB family protein [Alkalihalobacillus macyae]|uniref:GrpB family protein n=1 Tax=Guptibacillus hwajinpoensis TaxID=208199 RepID=UPI00273B9407|nr:GrpB family protein [Alkalihalobacillus macyae]MDP4550117.1 GrpB family protein [Alkalihalobacillus macyae]